MVSEFSGLSRQTILENMANEIYDLIIIGGGITGAGIALDASLRGMKVALVEMQDFAAGTSSRSTKLVHGGLRYLKQFQVGLVAEVGKEREIVYENGPHVTSPEWMLLPIYKNGTFGKVTTSVGIRLYDYLAGVKKTERRKMLSIEETLSKEPLLKEEGLLGGGYYVEYRTDDARLTIEVLKEASHRGADIVNYTRFKEFIFEDKRIIGVRALDTISNRDIEIRGKIVVNATGPWADQILQQDYTRIQKHLQLTKGIHIVIDQTKFPLQQAVYFDTPDGRMIFAIPREGKTYIGTTDTFFEGDLLNPKANKEDHDYLLKAIKFIFPKVNLTDADIESSWAGVRPLIYEEGKNPSEISRKDEIWFSESGLLTIAGGKLTGYRKMAENVVNKATMELQKRFQISFTTCLTRTHPISGGRVGGAENYNRYVQESIDSLRKVGFTKVESDQLARKYGSNVEKIIMLWEKYKDDKPENLSSFVFVQLIYGIYHEMTIKPTDFFIRRTGALYFNIKWVEFWKEPVLQYMATIFGWSQQEIDKYRMELSNSIIHSSPTSN